MRNETRVSTFTTLIQHSSGSPIYSNQRRRINKRNPDWKRRSKLSLFEDDMILHIENPEDSIRKLLELSEFSKVTGYKINTQISLAFLDTNNETSEREIKESIPFTIATKIIQYLGMNLPKETNYTQKIRTLLRTKENDINRCRDIPCSWVGRINTVKITIPPNTIYSFNVLKLYQITNGIFHRTRTKNFTTCMETRKTPNSQRSLENN